jgi:hypothetical protein
MPLVPFWRKKMPLLASKDLVNWTHAGRIYSRLGGVHADFTFPGKACSAGSQDGEVGFFRGTYYLFNWSTKYRGFVCKAAAPEGPWSEPMQLSHGAIVTLISSPSLSGAVSGATGRVAGLALKPLQSAHVAEGSAAIEIPRGAALLFAAHP